MQIPCLLDTVEAVELSNKVLWAQTKVECIFCFLLDVVYSRGVPALTFCKAFQVIPSI